jgi:16S rRNA (cytidine1402-2'-O)-methyltransferase
VTSAPGRLLLVPNTLDLGTSQAVPIEAVLPAAVLREAARLGHWVAEDAKTARAFLKRVDAVVPLAQTLQAIDVRELPRPTKGRPLPAAAVDLGPLLQPLRDGADLGLLSEAGLPAVADPGALLVAAAHAEGIVVRPLCGPSSITLALAASGLQGQSFAFVGYLPVEPGARAARVRALEAHSRREQQTQIAIETPYRNAALMHALMDALHPDTRLAVACGLTLDQGWCRMAAVRQWHSTPPSFDDKHLPAVFLWLAQDARAGARRS